MCSALRFLFVSAREKRPDALRRPPAVARVRRFDSEERVEIRERVRFRLRFDFEKRRRPRAKTNFGRGSELPPPHLPVQIRHREPTERVRDRCVGRTRCSVPVPTIHCTCSTRRQGVRLIAHGRKLRGTSTPALSEPLLRTALHTAWRSGCCTAPDEGVGGGWMGGRGVGGDPPTARATK